MPLGDLQKQPGDGLGSLLWVALLEQGLNQTSSRGPCQPQLFCGSVILWPLCPGLEQPTPRSMLLSAWSVCVVARTRLLNWTGTSTGHKPVQHQAHQAAHARKLPPPLLHPVNVQHRWRLQSRLWNTVWPPWWWASLLNCRSRLWVWMVSDREVSVLILTHLNSKGYNKRVFSFSFYIWQQKNNIHSTFSL